MILFCGAGRAAAQAPPPSATATRVASAPAIDGVLDDAAWSQAPAITSFTQRDPEEGRPASEATDIRIIYDHEALYVGATLRDGNPVTSRLGRRDMPITGSDWLRISIDSLHDRRTAFRFDVNPSGVRRDAAFSGGSTNGEGDLAWDGVWDAAAHVDETGWRVEIRIPFSQLYFSTADRQTWGLQIERIIDRRQETSSFSFTPKSELGGVPAFGTLSGLEGLRPGRKLELLPYLLTRARNSDASGRSGLDARYRITSNVTLAATANPDFGQVEVDPAVINLTAYETRFEEKRPFFVEGASSFKFGGTVGGPSAAAASVFYSRRLGRAPQLSFSGTDLDMPETATILGAAKLSGKTPGGWSIGVLNAVTDRETATSLNAQGIEQRGLVEPRTNYFVGRVARELRHGQTSVGGIFTSLTREDAVEAAGLRRTAHTTGLDFVHEFAHRTWAVTGFLIGTQVTGTEKAILATQRSSTRYFQRPDARAFNLDPRATSMNGAAASVQLKKSAGLHWTTDSWIQMVSPGFEINDVGFLTRADRRGFGQGVTYSERRPGKVFREWRSTTYINRATNFDGDLIDYFYWTSLSVTHLSYWQFNGSVWYEPERTDDRFTRGGPTALRPAVSRYIAGVRSDPRRRVTAGLDYSLVADRAGSRNAATAISLTLRPSPRWNLSAGPQLTVVHQDAQYVTAVADAAMTATSGTRYIFAPLDQKELSVITRLNYTFTPNVSLEMYAQPLVSNGAYGAPKQFQRPASYEFAEYGKDFGSIARAGNGYTVDPDGSGPLAGFNVPDRSFTTRSLRGNAVVRWEYRPGSTFFLVWQQDRLNPARADDFSLGRTLGEVFTGKANNVLAVKWTYWINP